MAVVCCIVTSARRTLCCRLTARRVWWVSGWRGRWPRSVRSSPTTAKLWAHWRIWRPSRPGVLVGRWINAPICMRWVRHCTSWPPVSRRSVRAIRCGLRMITWRGCLRRRVPVIGAGTPARRIALMFATRGGLVRIHARNADRGTPAVDYVQQQRDELSENRSRMGTRPRRICRELDDAVADAWLAVESIPNQPRPASTANRGKPISWHRRATAGIAGSADLPMRTSVSANSS